MNPAVPAMPERVMRRLCICADDFGLAPEVQRAVLALIERGVVNATSCMVRRAGWPAGAAALRGLPRAAADIGLHLDLTRTDDSAAEASLAALIRRCYTGQIDRRALAAQIDEQLDRFDQALGRAPDHVDGHRHVHQLPVVRDLLLDALERRYGARRPWLRGTRARGGLLGAPPKQRLIHALGGAALERAAARRGFALSGALLGVYDFTGTADAYRQRLMAWFAQCHDGDVLMCHPAAGAVPGDGIAAARQRELAVLAQLSPQLDLPGGSVRLQPHSRR